MRAIVLSVGDELVLGQTVDTNSAWISRRLAAVGCDVVGHATVADDQPAIETALLDAAGRCDVLICSGGIGPTPDDLTRQALAVVLGVPLERNEGWMERLRGFWAKRGGVMPEMNAIQAMIPAGATMIDNTAGTAAGIDAVYQSGDLKTTCRVFVMPGVPKEMKTMFDRDVLPHVAAAGGGAAIRSATLHTFGVGESAVAERLGELMTRGRNPSVGTTVANGVVSLRVNSRFGSADEAQAKLDETATACRAVMGDLIYGEDERTLPQAVMALLRREDGKNLTVATAESCTGGLLAGMLTDEPGSSAHFKSGWVTYSNLSKYERLGVPEDVINVYGAVSEPVVERMAKAARRLANTDFALAVSGVAGPDGGSPTKPVGTVCLALASRVEGDKTGSLVQVRTFTFPGDRAFVRDRSAKMALTMLRFHLLGVPMPF